jgi:chemotaxis protein methyltransferase CheR
MADRERDGTRAVRIWSAGCSSGEEPYSIAMTLRDMGLQLTHPHWSFDILGTDLNTERLDAARRGEYGARAVRNLEGTWLGRFFETSDDRFRLKDDIKRSVRFREGNLTSDRSTGALPAGADIIVCKNVAIYFRAEATRRLVERLYDALNDGGYLVLGHSESLWQMESGLTLVEHDGVFCYRKDEKTKTPPSCPAPAFAGQPTGRYERCLEAFRNGAWDQAETEVRELIRSSRTFVPGYLLLGGLYAQRGRYAEAREQAERVLGLNDMDARAYLLLGMIDARAGRSAEAVVSLRRALYLDDALALAYFWLGTLYRDRGDVDRACGEHLELVRRHEQHTLDFTEEFESDLTPAQIVHACLQTVRRLRERS